MRHVIRPMAFVVVLGLLPAPVDAQSAHTLHDSEKGRLAVTTVATGLEFPWSLAFLPDGRMLVTERPGRLRVVAPDGTLSGPVRGVPAVHARGQGGLLDVAVDPGFAENGLIYLSYAEKLREGAGTAVSRARLDGLDLREVELLFRQAPKVQGADVHFGSRLVLDGRGHLFITLGERNQRADAQRLDRHQGKIVRIYTSGLVPADNPFADRADALPEIWSYGHRNVQAATWDAATGRLWEIEHGPRGGDELNLVEPGKNYGWPVITYGIEYQGPKIGEGLTQMEGMEQPVYYWDPVIAPSGMIVYRGELFPGWNGSILVGGLGSTKLVRLHMNGTRVAGEEWLLADRGARIRDVQQGPGGEIYVLTEEGSNSRLLRLVPAAAGAG